MMLNEAYGVQIFEKDGKVYARYDSGEIAENFVFVEINMNEANKILTSSKNAYDVLLNTQIENRKTFTKI